MARYYFYSADMYYEDKQSPNVEVRKVGDYQGVYAVDDDSAPPDQIFMTLFEELKNTIPEDVKENAYYHITQFNNVS